MWFPSIILAASILVVMTRGVSCRYEPTWDSLNSRPLPDWYDDVKFGIFIHWGVYSVPGLGSEWFWNYWKNGNPKVLRFMAANYPPNFTYGDFASKFTAEFYDPDHWADVIEASGARYVVLTSKHHDGYTLWPSKVSYNWNSMDVGPKRDLVGDLALAIKKKPDIHFGLYHSMMEWYHPLFLIDEANKFKTRHYPAAKTMPELYEIVMNYEPEVLWSDAAPGGAEYYGSMDFIAWLYNDSPVKDRVVINDRWGGGTCKNGGFWTCGDRFNPGKLMEHKWENAMTIDKSCWGYRRDADLSTYLTIEELIASLIRTVSCGGNLLMNIGPTSDGRIIPIFEERLSQVGQWLKVNGEAIYGTKPWTYQSDSVEEDVWYTSKEDSSGNTDVYAIMLTWPRDGVLNLAEPLPSSETQVTLLGYHTAFEFVDEPNDEVGISIILPVIPFFEMPCQWAWVLKLSFIRN